MEDFKGFEFIIVAALMSFVLLEICWSMVRKNNVYNFRETVSNLTIFAGAKLSRLLIGGWVFFSLDFVYRNFSILKLPDTAFTFIAAIIFVDFLYYWEHRLLHEVKFFWAFHEIHHSSPWYNLSTSFRLNWFSPLITPVFFFPAALLGFSPKHILGFFALNLLYQFWLHTESIGKLGFLEGIINTPSAHRVHHGANALYIDRNYAGILVLWDRLFNTYEAETEKVIYGVTTGFQGHNPVKAVFHGFADYAGSLRINKSKKSVSTL